MAFGPPLVIGEEFWSFDGIEAIYVYGSWAAPELGLEANSSGQAKQAW